MQRQVALAGKRPGFLQIVARQHLTVVGVFQAQQAGGGKMDIVGFDFRRHFIQRQRTIGCGVNRLWLNTAEYCRAAGFVQIVVRPLADDILFAALTVAEQANEVGLGASGQKQRRLFAREVGGIALQFIDGRVVAIHIVPDRGGHHGLQHGAPGTGNGITA